MSHRPDSRRSGPWPRPADRSLTHSTQALRRQRCKCGQAPAFTRQFPTRADLGRYLCGEQLERFLPTLPTSRSTTSPDVKAMKRAKRVQRIKTLLSAAAKVADVLALLKVVT
jgi:hypothetical protein